MSEAASTGKNLRTRAPQLLVAKRSLLPPELKKAKTTKPNKRTAAMNAEEAGPSEPENLKKPSKKTAEEESGSSKVKKLKSDIPENVEASTSKETENGEGVEPKMKEGENSASGDKQDIDLSEPSKLVFEFKVTLFDIEPPIWRRFQIPASASFFDLNIAIVGSMGWQGVHMVHIFRAQDPDTKKIVTITPGRDEFGIYGGEALNGTQTKLTQFLKQPTHKVIYQYTHGEAWEHEVVLEQILPRKPALKFPKCLAGERACPPEEIGGVDGYLNLVTVLKDRKHPEYQELREWLVDCAMMPRFNPEKFNVRNVKFNKMFQG